MGRRSVTMENIPVLATQVLDLVKCCLVIFIQENALQSLVCKVSFCSDHIMSSVAYLVKVPQAKCLAYGLDGDVLQFDVLILNRDVGNAVWERVDAA